MKSLILLLLFSTTALAQTNSNANVNAWLNDGSGSPLSSTGGALNVNVTGGGGGSTGGLTDTQLRASPVPVSGSLGRSWSLLNSSDSVSAYQAGAWNVGRTWSLTTGTDSISALVSNFPATQAISAAALPLPAGAATAANQTNGSQIAQVMGTTSEADVATSLKPVVMGARNSTGLGTWETRALQTSPLPLDANGNQAYALNVYDFSQGHETGLNPDMTSTSGDVSIPVSHTQTIFLEIYGTWTGSIVPQILGQATATSVPLRLEGSSTIQTSITGNGVYVIEGEITDLLNIKNNITSGTATLYAFGTPWATGYYSRQAGAWNVGVTNWPSSQAVTGTVAVSNLPATQAVSGSVSVSNLPATQAVSGSVSVSNFPATQAVSASALPLPTGAATAANQSTSNTSLASIDSKLTSPLTVTGTVTANVQGGNATAVKVDGSAVTQPVSMTALPVEAAANSSPIGSVSLGNSTGKTNVMKTGTLVSAATTADQVVLTYTVTTGKTFYLSYWSYEARLTTLSATGAILGACSMESPAGTKLETHTFTNGTTEIVDRFGPVQPAEPQPIASATVIRIVCTPAAATSTTWLASFGGYEK